MSAVLKLNRIIKEGIIKIEQGERTVEGEVATLFWYGSQGEGKLWNCVKVEGKGK